MWAEIMIQAKNIFFVLVFPDIYKLALIEFALNIYDCIDGNLISYFIPFV